MLWFSFLEFYIDQFRGKDFLGACCMHVEGTFADLDQSTVSNSAFSSRRKQGMLG